MASKGEIPQRRVLAMKTTLKVICTCVCEYFNLLPEDLFKNSKKVKYVYPRHIYHYLSIQYTAESLRKIGYYGHDNSIGKSRDHCTVLNSKKFIEDMISINDKTTYMDVYSIEAIIQNSIYLENVLIPTHFNLVSKCQNYTESFI